MAPYAEDPEQTERRGAYRPAAVHGAGGPPPARAWLQREDRSPGESRRLLCDPPSPKLQAGLTLGVWNVPRKQSKCARTSKSEKPKVKTKFQERSEKLYSVLKPPYFILSLVLIMVCIHLARSERVCEWLQWSPGAWWRQPWRLLSYGLIHASTTHLATNAIVALAVGWVLEREQSRWRVCAVWCGGLAAGALGAGLLQPRVRVVGASAAVYALLTAHIPNVCLRFGHIPLWWFRPLSVVVLAASESASWALRGEAAGPERAQAWATAPVAWSSHALGAAVGLPLGLLLFTGENSSKVSVRIGRVAAAVCLLVGLACAAVRYSRGHDLS